MTRLLISYRRADSEAITGRIHDRLVLYFGKKSVFLDVEQLPLGVDFRRFLRDKIAKCEVVLAIIGPDWGGRRQDASARIHDEADPVRLEIETALQASVRTIPVLVNGATMPPASGVPTSLADFCFLNAAKVDTGPDFHLQMEKLIRSLNGPREPFRWGRALGAIARGAKSKRALAGFALAAGLGSVAIAYANWDRLVAAPPKTSAVFLMPPEAGIIGDDATLKQRAFSKIWAYFIDGLSHQTKYAVIPNDDELNQASSTFHSLFLAPQISPWVILSTNLVKYGDSVRHRIEFLARPSIYFQGDDMRILIEFGTFDAEKHDFRPIDDARVEIAGPRSRADFLAVLASYRLTRNLLQNAGLSSLVEHPVAEQFIAALRAESAGSTPAGLTTPQSCETFACVDSFGEASLAGLDSGDRSAASQLARNTAAEAIRLGVGRVD